MNETTSITKTVFIRSGVPFWQLDWKEFLQYRDLLWLLVRRDFVSKYKQTVLGPSWAIIQPVATTLVFSIVFGRLIGISTEGKPAFLFYLSGLVVWNLFTGTMGSSATALQANAGLFGKIYFPRLIPAVASSISALIPFALQVVTFGAVFIFYAAKGQVEPRWQMLLFPLFALHSALLAFGCGLLFSALTAVYRDLQLLLGFLLQLLMYLSPVIYPVSQFSTRIRWVLLLNPLSPPIEYGRWSLLGGEAPPFEPLLLSLGICFLTLSAGVLLYEKVGRDFVDRA